MLVVFVGNSEGAPWLLVRILGRPRSCVVNGLDAAFDAGGGVVGRGYVIAIV